MKSIKYKLSIIFLFLLTVGYSQIVNIPDANFKNKLVIADVSNTIAKDLSGNYFKVDANNDSEIQFSEALQVSYLDVVNANVFTIAGIESFLNLEVLDCQNNNLTSLNISGLVSLIGLYCNNNQILLLDTSSNINLKVIHIHNNIISTLVLPNSLTNLSCANNTIINLDISQCLEMTDLYCDNNNLAFLNLKNGKEINATATYDPFQLNVTFANNSSLEYLCYDKVAGLSSQFNAMLATIGSSSLVANSYCSFTPGGNYNTITGSMTFDIDSNGCDASDLQQPNMRIDINDGTNQGATFTNNSGNYNFYTEVGNYTIAPNMENSTWFTVSPISTTFPFANDNNNTVIQNFCIAPNGFHSDLEVVFAPIVPARPDFDAVYKIVYKNKGNQNLSGNVSLDYNDMLLDFVSSTTMPVLQSTGNISWDFSNLRPFENKSFYITFNVNSTVETPAVNIGDVLSFSTTINPTIGDEIPADNTFLYNQAVVGAFDPNDITCLEGNVVSPTLIGEYLHYIINFENTGNLEAENVVIKIEVDPSDYDINSLRLLNTSHDSCIKIKENVVEFVFESINLVASNGNGNGGGHGNILLKIQTKNNLVLGDLVTKNAKIFFDYNAPIETNIESTIFQSLSNSDFVIDNSVAVFPNPTKDKIGVSASSNIKNVHVYDIQGRLLEIGLYDDANIILDLSRYNHGIYLLKIITEDGVGIQKVIKE